MTIDNAYYLADPLEQLKPQRLDGNIFFGPLNTLTQHQFIECENIRLLIGVGLSTHRLASILNGIPSFAGRLNEFLFLNFDQNFDHASIIGGNGSPAEQYCCHNSSLLKLLIENFLTGNSQSSVQDGYRCLTPTPEAPDFSQLVDGDIKAYYDGGNVCSDQSSGKFVFFNDLLTIFKRLNPAANVLVFSQNGNDMDLVTFLISALLKKNPSVKVMEAYQYIKSIRPTIDVSLGEALNGCGPLAEFHHFLMTKEQHSYAGCNQTPQIARKRGGSIVQEGTPEPADERIVGKRGRFD